MFLSRDAVFASERIIILNSTNSIIFEDGDVECSGDMKNHDTAPISRSISEMIQNRVIVTVEGE